MKGSRAVLSMLVAASLAQAQSNVQSLCIGSGMVALAPGGVFGDWACLEPGQALFACTGLGVPGGKYILSVQNDLSLVVYETATNASIWNSGTRKTNGPYSSVGFSYANNGNVYLVEETTEIFSLFSYGSDGLFCINSASGILMLYNAGQSSLTNPIWTANSSFAQGTYLVKGYPTLMGTPGPAPIFPTVTVAPGTIILQPTSEMRVTAGIVSGFPSNSTATTGNSNSASDNASASSGLIAGSICAVMVVLIAAGIGLYFYKQRTSIPKPAPLLPTQEPNTTTNYFGPTNSNRLSQPSFIVANGSMNQENYGGTLTSSAFGAGPSIDSSHISQGTTTTTNSENLSRPSGRLGASVPFNQSSGVSNLSISDVMSVKSSDNKSKAMSKHEEATLGGSGGSELFGQGFTNILDRLDVGKEKNPQIFTDMQQLLGGSGKGSHFDAIAPELWDVGQTLSWLSSLGQGNDTLRKFREQNTDGQVLKALAVNHESCRESLRRDFMIEDLKTRLSLSNEICKLFAGEHLEGPGYAPPPFDFSSSPPPFSEI
ncbi:UNVERIFIED_CONTAM: hypothetical protein HDU68_009787 [Siphonaria sp. JEL0065]|nr:hypothetical protein HDU68_009787 [Siphonaria sp. JEL0065]